MNYIPRLTAPDTNDPNYYGNINKYVANGITLPNCTVYVYGRWLELGVNPPLTSLGSGYTYYNHKDPYRRSKEPVVGAIMCFDKNTKNQFGHVAIVEEVHDDGTITISESDGISMIVFRTQRIPKNFNLYGLPFQGYIINPNFPDIPPKPPKKYRKRKFNWAIYTNKIRKMREN